MEIMKISGVLLFQKKLKTSYPPLLTIIVDNLFLTFTHK